MAMKREVFIYWRSDIYILLVWSALHNKKSKIANRDLRKFSRFYFLIEKVSK